MRNADLLVACIGWLAEISAMTGLVASGIGENSSPEDIRAALLLIANQMENVTDNLVGVAEDNEVEP